MTTPAAEAYYLAEYLSQWADKGYAVHNPDNKPVEELPIIWGFNNGGSSSWGFDAVLIAEDGEILGGHMCSHEGYMRGDLGILEGSRPDRHETFRQKYPGGYRMDFVSYDDAASHPGLKSAFAKNAERRELDEAAGAVRS